MNIDKIKHDYNINGVTVIRNAIDSHWIKEMQTAIDTILDNPGLASIEYTPNQNKGRYYGDFFFMDEK